MMKVLKIVLACALLAALTMAQEQTPPPAKPDPGVLKEFTRSGKVSGVSMNFVLVTDKTADVLFEAPGKYSVKALARMSTLVYVQGTPEKDVEQLDMKYTMEQDGQTVDGTPHNIKNFQGGAVTKGNRIDGLVQFDKKLDLTHPFKIKNSKTTVEFKLSSEALKILGI